ncbi:MAG: class I SAM-dependent methyltransferase [Thermodesulfobacteriota bacterium]
MHKFNPEHIGRLLRADRLGDSTPEQMLRSLGLKEGDTFADVGCGPGFFTIPAALITGPAGTVYAIDTQQEMLDSLLERKPPANVVPVRSGEHSIPVPGSSADMALAAYVLHEAQDKRLFLEEVRRIIRKGGTIAVIDWKKQVEEHGPPVEDRVTEGAASGLVKEAGFTGVKTSSLNDSHYLVTAVKA